MFGGRSRGGDGGGSVTSRGGGGGGADGRSVASINNVVGGIWGRSSATSSSGGSDDGHHHQHANRTNNGGGGDDDRSGGSGGGGGGGGGGGDDDDFRDGGGDEQTVEDLRETISTLKSSLMTHATSSAESQEAFATLQGAHDALYREHVHLQEQMDDAVELLKYLKEEKGGYESRIEELRGEVARLRGQLEGDVVSMTIENLTKEKMDLRDRLEELEGREDENRRRMDAIDRERTELESRVEGLGKVKEAYDIQTRQQLEHRSKMSLLEAERGELVERVRRLEGEVRERDESAAESGARSSAEADGLRRGMEENEAALEEMTRQRDGLLAERKSLENRLDGMRASQAAASSGESSRKRELEDLQKLYEALAEEKEGMRVYASKMEESLMKKDEAMETLEGEFEAERAMLHMRLKSTRDELEDEREVERSALGKEMEELRSELKSARDRLDDAIEEREEADHEHAEVTKSLGITIEELGKKLEEQREASKSMGETLEREMQERLAQRIAVQLHEQKIAMEARMREELEAEFGRRRDEDAEEARAGARDLEERLRDQLQQVRDERERWQRDQDEIQRKVTESQEQFGKVREGFKKKVEKEKARAKELQKANDEKEVVIEKLSDEYQGVMEKLQDLQKLQDRMASDRDETEEKLRRKWEGERADLEEEHRARLEEASEEANKREEEYADRVDELRKEVDELLNEQATHESERGRWAEERKGLERKYGEKDEELRRAMDDLEQLNSENAEYLSKIEAAEEAAATMKKDSDDVENSRVKFSALQIEVKELTAELAKKEERNDTYVRELEQLNSDNDGLQQRIKSLEQNITDFSSDLDTTKDERNKLRDSLEETNELCLEMESNLSSYKQEKEQMLEEHQSKVNDLEKLRIAQSEAVSASAELAKSEKEKAEMILAETESKHQEVVSGLQDQVSKLIDQLSSISSEKAEAASKFESMKADLAAMKEKAESKDEIREYEAKIDALKAEIEELKETNAKQTAETAQVDISGYETEIDALKAGIEALKETNAQLTAERAQVDTSEYETKIGALEAEIEKLKEANAQLTSQTAQFDTSEFETKIGALKAEIYDLKETNTQLKAGSNDVNVSEYETKIEDLKSEIEELKATNAKLISENTEVDNSEHELKIEALQSEIDKLKETNSQLAAENAEVKAQTPAPPQSPGPDVEDLMKDLVEVNNNYQRLQQDHRAELQKLRGELRDTKDNNVVLEEAVQDIQVEKEDLELETEELATKLADLTTQAKKMLLNNESLEEDLQDQQIEYEDRLAELEQELEDLREEKFSDDDSLQQKHKAALETIVKLKKDIDSAGQHNDGKIDEERLNLMEEENLELRVRLDHLSAENDAAKEIKSLVFELKTKNLETAEMLRVSQEQNDAAADIIEGLKEDNERLGKDIAALQNEKSSAEGQSSHIVPFQQENNLDSAKMREVEAELRHYKSIVLQMEGDRSVFNRRLSDLMVLSDPAQDAGPPQAAINEGAIVAVESRPDYLHGTHVGEGATVPASEVAADGSYAPPSPQLIPSKDEVERLTIENGQLAQRLGGAVAEKEFAMTTLSKLGAKMEELMERNKLLSEIADVKSKHGKNKGGYYPGGHSVSSQDFKPKQQQRGLDPDASSEIENRSEYQYYGDSARPEYNQSSARHDDPSAYSDMASTLGGASLGGSTILSYEPSRKLDPEPTSYLGGIPEGDGFDGKRSVSSKDSHDRRAYDFHDSMGETASIPSEPQVVKVPGGEYYGQLNSRGQKHGNGKMKYDNGNEYDGQWKNNKRDGKGTTKYASGNVYTGTWKSGKRHGFGVFHIKKTGDIYRGNWAQGLKCGPGVYEYEDGELDVSFYQDDIRVGEGVRWSASRDRASRLVDGQLVGEEGDMPVESAMQLTKQLGFVV